MDNAILLIALLPLLALVEAFIGHGSGDDEAEAPGAAEEALSEEDPETDVAGAGNFLDDVDTGPPSGESAPAPAVPEEPPAEDEPPPPDDLGGLPVDPPELLAEPPGADYLLDEGDLPATLEYFLPGQDSVTLQLGAEPPALSEVELEGGGTGLAANGALLVTFPNLDALPVEAIFVTIGEDGTVYTLTDLPEAGGGTPPSGAMPEPVPAPETDPEPVLDPGPVGGHDNVISIAHDRSGPDGAVDVIEGFDPADGDVLRITLPADYAGAMQVTFEVSGNSPHGRVLIDGDLAAILQSCTTLDPAAVEVLRGG